MTKTSITWWVCCGIVAWCSQLAGAAELRPSNVFSDHMVLQRQMPIPVWGWADAGQAVVVSLNGVERETRADQKGYWRVVLDPMEAGGPYQMMIRADGQEVVLDDVMLGEVWICSGQSNMEWNLANTHDPQAHVRATNRMIRHFNVERKGAREPQRETGRTHAHGRWLPAGAPHASVHFSAVGYHFAERVHEELGCAVGLIKAAVGATAIRPWMSPLALNIVPEDHPVRVDYEQQRRTYQDALAGVLPDIEGWIKAAGTAIRDQRLIPDPPVLPAHPVWNDGGSPSQGYACLFNGMLAPLVPYAVRGVLWYQGESDATAGLDYLPLMEMLVSGWRATWRQPALPFYYVQLASFQDPQTTPKGGHIWAYLREAQRLAMDTIPDSGMAVAIDIGEGHDIHPRNKLDVGRRLARWALHQTYGQRELVPSGPLFRGAQPDEQANAIRVTFDHVADGLIAGRMAAPGVFEPTPDKPIKGFAIAGADAVWHWAHARVEGEGIWLSSEHVPVPLHVRYAFDLNPDQANLYNTEGLPASPFRTDTLAP